jgi:hypothetical protein
VFQSPAQLSGYEECRVAVVCVIYCRSQVFIVQVTRRRRGQRVLQEFWGSIVIYYIFQFILYIMDCYILYIEQWRFHCIYSKTSRKEFSGYPGQTQSEMCSVVVSTTWLPSSTYRRRCGTSYTSFRHDSTEQFVWWHHSVTRQGRSQRERSRDHDLLRNTRPRDHWNGWHVNSTFPRMVMIICKCTLYFVSLSNFHSCSPLKMCVHEPLENVTIILGLL